MRSPTEDRVSDLQERPSRTPQSVAVVGAIHKVRPVSSLEDVRSLLAQHVQTDDLSYIHNKPSGQS